MPWIDLSDIRHQGRQGLRPLALAITVITGNGRGPFITCPTGAVGYSERRDDSYDNES